MNPARPHLPTALWAVALTAVAVMAAVVTGCGVSRPASAPSPGARRGRLTKIVYINPLPNDPLWDRFGTCMTTEARKHSITVSVVGPAGGNVDVQTMQNLLSQAVATKAPAIVTWSLGAVPAFDALFKQARAEGALVATLLSAGGTKNQNFDVGTSEVDFAGMQIAAVSRRVGVQHVGVIAQGQTGAGYTDYVQSVKRAAAAHANVKLEDIAYDNGTFTNDVTLVSNMLTAHPDINVVLNYSGFPGMLTAIQERHKVGKVFAFVSSDNPQATISYIDKGLVAGVRFIPACASGRLVVRSLLALRAGRRVPHQLSDGERIVTGAEFKRLVAKGAL